MDAKVRCRCRARLSRARRRCSRSRCAAAATWRPSACSEDHHLFGLSGDVGSNAVEVYVHRLRKMLADSGATVKIHTVRGIGYLMAEDKAE
jgi:hypothetical protein